MRLASIDKYLAVQMGLARHLLYVVTALFILIGIFATPAPADFAADAKLCRSSSNLDEKIAACTRQISFGRLTGRDLAITYSHRGGAYRNKGEYDRAIADHNEA